MMIRFMIYLFETGLCLSLLYLAYWLFLRKETYFNFNRLFLVGSIVLALSVPLLHLNLIIPLGGSLEGTAAGIVKFRDYYEELISMTDADFGTEPGLKESAGGSGMAGGETGTEGIYPPDKQDLSGDQTARVAGEDVSRQSRQISVARILLFIYTGGVFYFLVRLVYLFIRLYLLALRNGVTRQEGFRMVEIREEISPFSFFRLLFINNGTFNDSELHQVLEHEKAHIRQQHSMDHLFAHGLAVFQWFNPFAWQIRSALKTTHEYIADRQVISKGITPVDYQTLLLKQVIGYHSVELVNNFNLKPIKKRIAMMSKRRSGLPAKMKAMLVIPVAIIVFFLFADFTIKGPGNRMLDLRAALSAESQQETALTGLWERYKGMPGAGSSDPEGLILITDHKFSFVERYSELKEYYWRIDKGNIILSNAKGSPGTGLKIEYSGDEMKIWWNDDKHQTYRKTDYENTLDRFTGLLDLKIEPPNISQFRILDKPLTSTICIGYKGDGGVGLLFNGHEVTIENLGTKVEERKSDFSKLDQPMLTTKFMVDKNMPMSEVAEVREILRNIGSLKVADVGYPEGDLSVSPLQYHMVGLPRVLPPLDAKILDKDQVEKTGTKIFVIDLSEKNTSPRDIDETLERFIRANDGGKYVFSLEYDHSVPYGEYIETVDIVFNVVYRFRKEMAMRRFQVPYAKLGPDLQKEIRRAYPMVLSEAWSGK